MIDPAWLRDNVETVRTAVRNRGADLSRELDTLLDFESRRRRLLPEIDIATMFHAGALRRCRRRSCPTARLHGADSE